MNKFHAWLIAAMAFISSAVAGRVTAPASARRAVTLLEYVLLAALVVVAVGVLGVVFQGPLNSLVTSISDAMGG